MSKGFTIVDDSDYPFLSKFRWFPQKSRRTTYAVTNFWIHGKRITMAMHRLILGNFWRVDHRNMDGLDNRRQNLRTATLSENAAHRKGWRKGLKGAYWHRATRRWFSQVQHQGINYFLGYFSTEKAAHAAYGKMARQLFGEYASIN